MSKINKTNIAYGQCEKIPLDLECQLDLMTKRGIRITSVESYTKKHEKIWNGLQSSFFGTDFSDDTAFKERWRCKCGTLIGKNRLGEYCSKCNSVVEYNDIDLNKFGWIILNKFSVMSPIYYAKISDALGKFEGESVLDKIITTSYNEEDGTIDFTDKEVQALSKHPYIKKGMQWFKDNFDEVISYYEKKKPGKADLFAEIKREKDLVWTHSIPVYSALLRTEMPSVEKGAKAYKLKVNTSYKAIIKLVNAINNVPEDEFDHYHLNTIDIELAAIQKELGAIFEYTIKDLTSKSGIINGKVLGGRYNFSSRDIIIPNSGRLRTNECELGYLPFLELFRYEIINLYCKLKGCTINAASNAWKKATNHFDPTMYSIMKHIVTDPSCKDSAWLIEVRNPAINYGSFNVLNVVNVKDNLSDKTLTLSSQVITPQNADFDGDVVNLYRIIGYDLIKRFRKNMDPRYNLMVSRMTGKANPEVLPIKDEIVAFWLFNNIK